MENGHPSQEHSDSKGPSTAATAAAASVSKDANSTQALAASLSALHIANEAELEGVPAVSECRVELVWEDDANAAEHVRQKESGSHTRQREQHKDAEGMYCAEEPLLARVTEAKYVHSSRNKFAQ